MAETPILNPRLPMYCTECSGRATVFLQTAQCSECEWTGPADRLVDDFRSPAPSRSGRPAGTPSASRCETCGEEQNLAGYCINKQCSRHGRTNGYLADDHRPAELPVEEGLALAAEFCLSRGATYNAAAIRRGLAALSASREDREKDAAREREACAQVCESRASSLSQGKQHSEANEARKCASAIRGRLAGSPLAIRTSAGSDA